MGVKLNRDDRSDTSYFFMVEFMLGDKLIQQKVVVFSDVSHVSKNIRNCFSKYRFILPDDVVQENNLVTNLADIQHIKNLYEFQKQKHFKYAPCLDEDCFPKENQSFLKMKVRPVQNLFSEAVADGLRMLVKVHGYPAAYLTTAYMVEMIAKWIKLMLAKKRSRSLSLAKEDKFKEAIEFLQFFIKFFDEIRFETKTGEQHKPIQKCVWISTMSMIDRANYYLYEMGYEYLLGGRFCTDCIENFFSQMRRANPKPTAMEFKWRFRALIIIHLTKPIKYGNCEHDEHDYQWLTELRDLHDLEEDMSSKSEHNNEIVVAVNSVQDYCEATSLTYVIGYLLLKTVFSESPCDTCQNAYSMASSDGSEWLRLIEEKCFVPNALTMPSEMAFQVFSLCESTFIYNTSNGHDIESFYDQIVDTLYDTILDPDFQWKVPQCCLKLLLLRFFKIRMYFYSSYLTSEAKETSEFHKQKKKAGFASKSVMGSQLT